MGVVSVGHARDPSHDPEGGDSGFLPPWWNNGPTASNGECGVPLSKRFAAPATGNGVFWYSFVYGNALVVQMSSEHNFTTGSRQWLWLEKTLASADRSRTPWVVVTSHRPIYSTQECETEDYVVSLHMREHLDDLLYKYQVNLALVAHTHSYERTCAVYKGACVTDGRGTVHITGHLFALRITLFFLVSFDFSGTISVPYLCPRCALLGVCVLFVRVLCVADVRRFVVCGWLCCV